jgi:hypothetical protein
MALGHDEVATNEETDVNVTQRIVGTGVALVIAVGGYGCRYALREATEDRADRIAENAADAFSDSYDPPTIPTVTTPPTTAAPETTTTPATTPAATTPVTEPTAPALPKGWPAELALVDGLTVESASDLTGPSVIGTVPGDVAGVTEAIRAQLATAGFTVDQTRSVGGVTIATGAAGEMTVLISPVPDDPAAVRVTYRLQPAA